MSQLNKEQRERDITVRALRAERVTVEEMLRDPTQGSEYKDDTFYEAELIDDMLRRMGECPAVTTTDPRTDDNPDASPLSSTVNTPIRYCTKPYHEEGDHEWF